MTCRQNIPDRAEEEFSVLVLGRMPAGASPRTHLAAGPWCFADREHLFPGWERRFIFAPEPLRDTDTLRTCARMAQAICVDSLPAIAERICPHAHNLPPVYWQTVLMPWAADVARQVAERWVRVLAMIDAWGKLRLTVPMLPAKCRFNFATEHDFTLRGALGQDYNHWLFCRLLEKVWPAAWIPKQGAASVPAPAERTVPTLKERLRRLVLGLPFPPMKGLRGRQSLRFSLALLHRAHGEDRSIDPQNAFNGSVLGVRKLLPPETIDIFMASLPDSIRRLRHPAAIRPARLSPRCRAASIMSYEDAPYRQKLAFWRAGGNRLFYVQHGGNYGQVAVACETELVEYVQSAFITWGWSRQEGCAGNFIPLPYPGLHGLEALGKSAKKNDHIIFVGTEMPAFPYRLDAHPTPLQVLAYREAKAHFFAELGPYLTAKCMYRPYFSLPGTFQDAQWLLPRFPRLRICTGPLQPRLLSCRLLVADHHGTTMLEALAANIPSIFYWDKKAWPLTKDAAALVRGLEEAGIFFPEPRAAARQAARVWARAGDWWASARVQNARKAYVAQEAMTGGDNPDHIWIKTLKKL